MFIECVWLFPFFSSEFQAFRENFSTQLETFSGTKTGNHAELLSSLGERLKSLVGELEKERVKQKELEEKLEEIQRNIRSGTEETDLRANFDRKISQLEQRLEQNVHELAIVREQSAVSRPGGVVLGYVGVAKGSGEVGGGRLEGRMMLVEQRLEKHERETTTIKVRLSLSLSLSLSL